MARKITGSLVETLTQSGISRRKARAIATRSHILSLNRRSFADLLQQISKQIDLRLNPDDLRLFICCRNSLVHRGGFYCATASEEERKRVPPKATKFDEYLFMISVVDAFLLRLVGYKGPYLVNTGGSNWEERQL